MTRLSNSLRKTLVPETLFRTLAACERFAGAARKNTGLSHPEFAELLGVSVQTLLDWEQERKQPDGAALTLLAIARDNPDALLAVKARNDEAAQK